MRKIFRTYSTTLPAAIVFAACETIQIICFTGLFHSNYGQAQCIVFENHQKMSHLTKTTIPNYNCWFESKHSINVVKWDIFLKKFSNTVSSFWIMYIIRYLSGFVVVEYIHGVFCALIRIIPV